MGPDPATAYGETVSWCRSGHTGREGSQAWSRESATPRTGGSTSPTRWSGRDRSTSSCAPGWVTHLDLSWQIPPLARFLERLAAFCRLILFDKQGTGLSDRLDPDTLPTLPQRMDDVRAVLDAVGSERAALFGTLGGGAMCGLFASAHPQRCSGLILYGTFAKLEPDTGLLSRLADSQEAALERIEREWVPREWASRLGPQSPRRRGPEDRIPSTHPISGEPRLSAIVDEARLSDRLGGSAVGHPHPDPRSAPRRRPRRARTPSPKARPRDRRSAPTLSCQESTTSCGPAIKTLSSAKSNRF